MAKGDKKKPVSKSIKARPPLPSPPAPQPALTRDALPQAGLQFPVGRIHRFLKARARAGANKNCPV